MNALPWAYVAAGFAAGFLGALGLGGGGVLVLALTLFLGVEQLRAQGINLLFFVVVGCFALVWHWRQGLISLRLALPAIVSGLLGSRGGGALARGLGGVWTARLFGLLLAGLGLWELLHPAEKPKCKPARHG